MMSATQTVGNQWSRAQGIDVPITTTIESHTDPMTIARQVNMKQTKSQRALSSATSNAKLDVMGEIWR